MSAEAVAALDRVQAIVGAYVEEYELDDGENVHHIPDESERAMIEDAIQGLIADDAFVAAWDAWRDVVRPLLAARNREGDAR